MATASDASSATEFPPIDFERFHTEELPRRLAEPTGIDAAREVARAGALAFRRSEGGAYTYRAEGDRIAVTPGEEGADTVIELDHAAWQNLVHDLDSPPGLLYGGRATCHAGNAMRFVRWDAALRAMYTGRPIFDPDRADLRDHDGAPLDVGSTFGLEDDDAEMAHFLRTAGYLRIRGVFSAEEIEDFRRAAGRLRDEARQGDQESWWGRNADGEEVLCRVITAGREPALRNLHLDPRITRLAELSDEDLALKRSGANLGVSVIYKNPEMKEGLSDLPWHRDCGMGGHAILCPVLIVSIFLNESSERSGHLRYLPGSWQGSCRFIDARHEAAPEGISADAEPGDVALHYGDVMHAAPPPTGEGPYRESVVMAFAREDARPHDGKRHYNDVLLGREDGQVQHLADVGRKSRADEP
jgi:ectoine hydroxylase-related dioxygenase (phytanoyl-CoA dioxygenase family)